jgi:hypothetical protein
VNSPWTLEELAAMRQVTRQSIEQTEAARPDARPLPPMTEEESLKLLYGMVDLAQERVLTSAEGFLFGQLMAQHRMSIEARMLGRPPGRYYVISEADIARMSTK